MMHYLPLLVASAALAGQAIAHPTHASSFKHHNILLRRQLAGDVSGVEAFPRECAEKCQPYINMGLDCSKLAFGSGKSEAELQMDVASCACSNDFFRSTVTCVQCAPQTFTQFADGYTPRQVVEMAASQCKALGREISGVDFSSLDGAAGDNAEDDSTASDNDKALEPSEGPGADDGNGNSIPPDPTPFLGSDDGIEPHESSEIESDDGVTPTASSDSGATFIPASSAAAATTPQGTGAGVAAVQAQQILAITVAFGVGAAYLF